jgi:hypothetical protein
MADVLRNLSYVSLGLLAAWPFYRLACYQSDFYYHEPGVGPDELTYYQGNVKRGIAFFLSMILSIAGLTFAVRHASKLLIVLGPWADIELPWCLAGGYGGTFGIWVLITRTRQHRFLRRYADSLLRCNACGYSLRGTEPVDDRLHCPECGNERTTEELAKEAEHLARFASSESKNLLP